MSWDGGLRQFLQERGTAHYKSGNLSFRGTKIYSRDTLLLQVDFTKNVAIFPGWCPITETEPAILRRVCNLTLYPDHLHSSFRDLRDAAPDMIYVPVLFMGPEHEHNLRYLNDTINLALRKLVRRKVKTGTQGIHYRSIESTLGAYVKFWDLGGKVHVPTMEERVERLNLQTRLAGFIGRRLAG